MGISKIKVNNIFLKYFNDEKNIKWYFFLIYCLFIDFIISIFIEILAICNYMDLSRIVMKATITAIATIATGWIIKCKFSLKNSTDW
jgi:hypothetical protein